MDIKVKCVDPLYSTRASFSLKKGQIYTVKKITATTRTARDRHIKQLFFELNEIPSADFLIRRFKIISEIKITLPDDINNIPI